MFNETKLRKNYFKMAKAVKLVQKKLEINFFVKVYKISHKINHFLIYKVFLLLIL